MIASLNQSSSSASCEADLDVGDDVHDRPHKQRKRRAGSCSGIDAQPYAAPFDRVAFTGNEIFDSCDAMAVRLEGRSRSHRSGTRIAAGLTLVNATATATALLPSADSLT